MDKLIRDGNNLGFVLEEQWQGESDAMAHFLAALKYEDCYRLDHALDISQNLDCYDFVPASSVLSPSKLKMWPTKHGCIRRNGLPFSYEHSQPPYDPELTM